MTYYIFDSRLELEMANPEENEAYRGYEALAIPCAGNLAKGNEPGHVVSVYTQASDDGQWMSPAAASLKYPVLRMLQIGSSGSTDLCHDCSRLEEI